MVAVSGLYHDHSIKIHISTRSPAVNPYCSFSCQIIFVVHPRKQSHVAIAIRLSFFPPFLHLYQAILSIFTCFPRTRILPLLPPPHPSPPIPPPLLVLVCLDFDKMRHMVAGQDKLAIPEGESRLLVAMYAWDSNAFPGPLFTYSRALDRR